MNKKICLIDGSGFIFRAFHALPPMYSTTKVPVNAVYGFVKSLMSVIENKSFDYLVVVFDNDKKTFRNNLYPQYKANRPPLPPEIIPQFSLIRMATKALNIASVELEGFEADDLIATYTHIAKNNNFEVEIISSDKDLMQLIDDASNIYMYDAIKKKKITSTGVLEKFGVLPKNVIDVQAILGDSTDNIPGVKGIGIKGASLLVSQFGDLQNIYNNLDKIESKSIKQKLIEHKEMAFLSLKLVSLDTDVKINSNLEDFKLKDLNPQQFYDFLQEVSFTSMANKIANKYKLLNNNNEVSIDAKENIDIQNFKNIENLHINNIDELKNIINKIPSFGSISFAFNPLLKTISFFFNNSYSYYINYTTENIDLLSDANNLLLKDILYAFENIFNNSSISKIMYNVKNFCKILKEHNMQYTAFEDIMLMCYLCDGPILEHSLDKILKENFNISVEQLNAYYIYNLYQIYNQKLILNKSKYLYENIDKPLVNILLSMETSGICVDKNILYNLSLDFDKKIQQIEQQVYQLCNINFNLSSPKQVGEILFEKLKFNGKKNKTGSWKTDSESLEELSVDENHLANQISSLIIEHRQLSKLKNTYTDKLPNNINPYTKRIHTTFLQCSTLTGRLSSVDPNLQNIPIKTLDGKNIRKAFIAKNDYQILSLDYSQIELRVLSVIANVKNLILAFNQNEDIHKKTASEIFHININNVDNELRRKAKAINFGIIYGQSVFGLAKQLNISKQESKEYIDKYFMNYPQINDYMKTSIEFAQKNHFVLTAFNRKCFIDNINSTNFNVRSFAQRSAINAIIQGTASDIMRLALRDIYNFINKNNLQCKMLLQIHDEVLLEVKQDIAKDIAPVLQKLMENVLTNNPFKLNIPLRVNYDLGKSWFDSH